MHTHTPATDTQFHSQKLKDMQKRRMREPFAESQQENLPYYKDGAGGVGSTADCLEEFLESQPDSDITYKI